MPNFAAARPQPNPQPSQHFFSNADLFRLVWPLVVEQLLAISLGFADVLMVASLGETAVSGVALVDSLSYLIIAIFSALATGGAVVCSHYIGGGNRPMISLAAKQLIYAITAVSLFLSLAGYVFQNAVLLVFGNIEPAVRANASTYLFYMLLSYPLIALYNSAAALFRAQGNSRVSMLTALLVNLLNIGGNALCIYGLKMGVEGVAIPTFVSRGVAAVLLLYLLYHAKTYHGKPAIDIHGIFHFHFDFWTIKHILAIGIPNSIENSMFQVGKILVMSITAMFGTRAIAANAAASALCGFSTIPGNALCLSLTPIVGQCLGAERPDEAVYFTKKLLVLTYAAMAVINIPLLLCTRYLMSFFSLSPETSSLASQLFVFHGVCAVLIWPLSWALPYALRAANDARFTMTVSLLSIWIVRIGFCYVFAHFTDWGVMGVWIAMIFDWILRAVVFTIRFARGKWQAHYRIEESA
jgi:putative MATE family efflux protein